MRIEPRSPAMRLGKVLFELPMLPADDTRAWLSAAATHLHRALGPEGGRRVGVSIARVPMGDSNVLAPVVACAGYHIEGAVRAGNDAVASQLLGWVDPLDMLTESAFRLRTGRELIAAEPLSGELHDTARRALGLGAFVRLEIPVVSAEPGASLVVQVDALGPAPLDEAHMIEELELLAPFLKRVYEHALGQCERRQSAMSSMVSDAQRPVLELLIQGLTEREIATRVFRSQHTVHDHVKGIYAAIGVRSRIELIDRWHGRQTRGGAEQDSRTAKAA